METARGIATQGLKRRHDATTCVTPTDGSTNGRGRSASGPVDAPLAPLCLGAPAALAREPALLDVLAMAAEEHSPAAPSVKSEPVPLTDTQSVMANIYAQPPPLVDQNNVTIPALVRSALDASTTRVLGEHNFNSPALRACVPVST